MEEHLNDSDKRVDVDNEISSHDIPEENSDVPDSRRGVSTEDDENSFPLEDGVEGGVTPLRVDDESNDSSRYNIPAIENHSNSSITEKMDSDEENVSLSVQTDDDDVDQNHTNDTSDNSEEDYQNETIESVVKVNENDRELALETPDDMDEKNQNLTIEPAAPDSLLGDIYNADDSVDKTGIQNADSSIEDSLQSKEEEFSEPEVTNGENSVSNEIKVQPEIDQENDVSVKSQSSTDESDFYGFDSATIEISVEKTNELMQTLSNKEGGIIRTNSLSGSTTPSNAEVDTNFIEAATVGDISNMISASDGQSIHIDGQTGENQTTALYADNQLKNSKKPNPVHPVLGVPVNIFDETLPSGSKRVKKKRKFFGDFEESDSEKASRKSSSSRPQEDGVKLLNNVNASGENKENFITDEKIKVESVTEGDTPRQNKGKRAYTFDISNPLLKEPFKFGWKREIYYRDLPEGSKSKLAYVSYYSPQNKKFKTIRQIVEHLPPGSELNTHHFTFSVQRIFNEPSEFEILREAKSRADLSNPESVNNDSFDVTSTSQSSAHFTPSENIKTIPKKKQSASSSRLVIKKPKYLRSTESEDDGAESLLLLSSTPSSTPKIVIKGASLNSAKANSSKSKFSSAKKEKKLSRKLEKSSKKSLPSAENVVDSTNSFDVSPVVSEHIDNSSATCSIRCPLALGSIPTLQCTICHNLYHFECCGFDASQPLHSYVCKSCRSRAEIQSKLLLAVSQSSTVTNTLNDGGGFNIVMAGSRSLPKNTKIVDGVTTWLPPSSNVQLSSRHATVSSALPNSSSTTPMTTLVQSILELDGRRFIIVPKESIVSISPNTNSAVNTYSGNFEVRQSDTTSGLTEAKEMAASICAETSRNYVVNASDVNSAGVLLVPVIPSGNEPYCNRTECGSSKRKLSEDSDSSMAKIARLDDELPGYHYRSALTLSNVAQLYNSLTFCFKFLTVRDLLRVSMSCKYLNRIASEPDLWTTVRLKNSKVRDWEGFARTLRKYGTKKLDLRKILCPSAPADVNAMWNAFLDNIASVISLEHIEFSRCNAHVVEAIARTCPNLVVINAVQLRNGDSLSLENFTKLKYLKELRLKGGLSIELSDHGLTFQSKETIRLLSLTSIKKMDSSVVSAIGDLSELNTLELGECDGQLVNELAVSIGKLNNLHRLRLEQITNLDPDFKLFASLKNLPQLKSLELINVEIRIGYCEAIAECQNIENLLIIPLYKTESATSNRLIVDSLPSLSKSLKSFIWGLTHELIRATDLYANQFLDKPDGSNDESKKSPIKGHDSIPIVKRISKNPDVDIMSVRNLEKMLATMLPETRIKVIRVAFALTWRQNLSDLLK